MVGKPQPAPTPDHGTRRRYNAIEGKRCRCEACRAANAAFMRDYRRTVSRGAQLSLELPTDPAKPPRK